MQFAQVGSKRTDQVNTILHVGAEGGKKEADVVTSFLSDIFPAHRRAHHP